MAVSKIKWGRFNKHIVNDLRVTDHHGLLVTDKIPSALSVKENAVYDMIALRLLEALSQTCIKVLTYVGLQTFNYDFVTSGCKVAEAGWRSIKGSFTDDDCEAIQELPELTKGDELKIKAISVLEKKTKPPALYTEAGLLSAMESAGKEIEHEAERKVLQNVGIGTPATRASIIETLFKRNYVERVRKSLIPTEKGLRVYRLVKDMKIANVAMTAEWELLFRKIENSESDSGIFQKEMEKYASSITGELLMASVTSNSHPILICPKCKTQQLIIRDKIIKCPDEVCNWTQFRNICGLQISLEDIESLVIQGKTSLLKGMRSKGGRSFDAYIVLDNNFKTFFRFEK